MRAYRIAYDGRPFHGFQRQPDVPTVEGAMLDALRKLDVLGADGADAADGTPLDTPPGYAAAGRTDAGVSAVGQVVAFEAPDWLTPRAFNGTLPPAVRAWASADAPDDFHATYHATRREYVYHLYAPLENATNRVPPTGSVDDDRVRTAMDRLAGERDFHNLTPDETGTERVLETSVERDGDVLRLRVAADGFPKQFVRRLATLVRAIGTGDAPLSKIDRVLSDESLSGAAGFGAAPPTPLILRAVSYPRLEFETDPEAVRSAREVFAESHLRAIDDATVTAALRDGVGDGDGAE